MTDAEYINILGGEGGVVGGGSAEGTLPVRAPAKPMPAVLPVLGLADFVVFPGMVVPLMVESSSSLRLVDDVVGGDRFVGLVLQRRPDVEDPLPADLWPVGCAARVLKMLKFPDGTVRILVEGLRRVRLETFESERPYLRANAVLVREVDPPPTLELTALVRHARKQFQEITELSPAMAEQVKVAALNTDEPGRLADLIASNLNLDLEELQFLLETSEPQRRLERLTPLLAREIELLSLGSKIQKEVATTVSRSQRDYFLREQMRVIQRELGEAEPVAPGLDTLRVAVEKAGMPPEVREVAERELERLRAIPPAVAEHGVARTYIEWLAHLPWDRSTEDTVDLDKASRILERGHHGLPKVKERLLEFLAVLRLRRGHKGPVLCLVGPPGVGKTSLGKSLAEALGRSFVRVSLGGMRDEAEIRGHRRTYVGAMPGRIIQGLRRAGSRNPVILLDELDKVGADFRGDPASALLEVLDPELNRGFQDHYLDVPFDLSGVWFLATANWLDPVHPALRDRMEVIEIPGYTEEEKLHIARRHLVPRQLAEHGLEASRVRFGMPALRSLVEDYTREAGVRQLEREIAAVARKSARFLAGDVPVRGAVKVTPERIREWLGRGRHRREPQEWVTPSGIATGLAWTPAGGDVLSIEATRMAGTGRLILTGSMGDVMKESAQAALSYVRTHGKELGVVGGEFEKLDVHVHVPAGAIPKDGPSAGLTMAVAIASLLGQRRVRPGVALTGEISLRGRVLAVGGVREKVLAAVRNGLRVVVMPRANEGDWDEIPVKARKGIRAVFVREASEAFTVALQESCR